MNGRPPDRPALAEPIKVPARFPRQEATKSSCCRLATEWHDKADDGAGGWSLLWREDSMAAAGNHVSEKKLISLLKKGGPRFWMHVSKVGMDYTIWYGEGEIGQWRGPMWPSNKGERLSNLLHNGKVE